MILFLFVSAGPLDVRAAAPETTVFAPYMLLTNAETKQQVSFQRELQNAAYTIVVFLSTECLSADAYGIRLQSLQAQWKEHGIQVIGVNSNPSEKVRSIAAHRRALGLTFPVFIDTDQVLANTVRAKHSPEFLVFDHEGHLLDHGGTVEEFRSTKDTVTSELETTVAAIRRGETNSATLAETQGCPIMRLGQPDKDI